MPLLKVAVAPVGSVLTDQSWLVPRVTVAQPLDSNAAAIVARSRTFIGIPYVKNDCRQLRGADCVRNRLLPVLFNAQSPWETDHVSDALAAKKCGRALEAAHIRSPRRGPMRWKALG
jgi:hypothetical protein